MLIHDPMLTDPDRSQGMAASGDLVNTETAWLEVVRKMDETYASLVNQQVELERKNQELESAHNFIADILGAMTDVLLIADANERVTKVNPALERAIGRPAATVIGLKLGEVFEPASAGVLTGLLAKLRASHRLSDLDLVLRAGDTGCPLSVNVSAMLDGRGRIIGAVLVGRPVGELRKAYADLELAHANLKRAQQRLVHSEKMASLGRLVAGVAHEINNPMSFIYGNSHALKAYGERLAAYFDALRRGDGQEAERIRRDRRIDALMDDLPNLLGGILEGAERTRDIVESLRRYASGQHQTREIIDLVPLIHTATRWVLNAQKADLPVAFDLPERADVAGHSGALQQVVMNLVQNALDAMGGVPSARLEISAGVAGPNVIVAVRDHGCGIPDEVASRLFDPFFTTKPVGKGTGLGLSISEKIVGDHGGHLEACNAPGGGAIFTMTLPLAAGTADAHG
jgi:two-component system, NtrC family, sensor histidine kinase HupT/HoxJ